MADNKQKTSDKEAAVVGTGTALGGGLVLLSALKKGKKLPKGKVKKLGKRGWSELRAYINKKGRLAEAHRSVNRAAGGGWFAQGAFSEIENTNNISMENYYDDQERLFSTGDEELDDILEEVYYSGLEDGYDYAYEEREYADSDSKDKADGAGTVAAGAGVGALAIGKHKANKAIAKGEKEAARLLEEAGAKGKAARAKVDAAFMEGRAQQGGLYDMIVNKIKYRKGSKQAEKVAEELAAKARAEGGKVRKIAEKTAAKIGKRSKIVGGAAIAAGGLLTAASGLKKKDNNQQKNYSDMEIRRKVFSLLEDENGEERYYSTTEFEMDYDWETGEKYFSEKEDKGLSTGAKIGIGAAGTAAAGTGLYFGSKGLNKVMAKKYKAIEGNAEAVQKLDKSLLGRLNKGAAGYRKGVDKAAGAVAGAGKKAWGGIRKAGSAVGGAGKTAWEWTKDKSGKYIKAPVAKVAKWAKAHPKAAIGIGLGTAALTAGGVVGGHALKKKNAEKKNNNNK